MTKIMCDVYRANILSIHVAQQWLEGIRLGVVEVKYEPLN